MVNIAFLTEKFYEANKDCPEIEQKPTRLYIRIGVLIDGDYVISHCLPQSMVIHLYGGGTDSDILTKYFERLVQNGLQFKQWYAGHYHVQMRLLGNYNILYHKIERIL